MSASADSILFLLGGAGDEAISTEVGTVAPRLLLTGTPAERPSRGRNDTVWFHAPRVGEADGGLTATRSQARVMALSLIQRLIGHDLARVPASQVPG
jgi:hypothetical protein